MRTLQGIYSRLKNDQRGQDMMEYALLLVLVSFIIYGWLPGQYTPALSNIWQRVKDVMCSLTNTCS
ncbi:MAG: hypothetical protein HY820_46100 [Acidobacteria bacterium]|nr:hypothetical protein [Acidobacteriota bacterium]